jgi:hypothetical protein
MAAVNTVGDCRFAPSAGPTFVASGQPSAAAVVGALAAGAPPVVGEEDDPAADDPTSDEEPHPASARPPAMMSVSRGVARGMTWSFRYGVARRYGPVGAPDHAEPEGHAAKTPAKSLGMDDGIEA